MKTATFCFDPSLIALLPKKWRHATGLYTFSGPQSAKHLIEALGIPHTELSRITVNGMPADTNYLVGDGDEIGIFGATAAAEEATEPRFAVDGHLGRLNARLRMLGFDCKYQADYTDSQLVGIAGRDGRVLLTRDRRLLMRKTVVRGCLVRSVDPPAQLLEVAERFALDKWAKPFRRCIRCNDLLRPVPKAEVIDQLKPLTRLYFEEFRICPSCRQIYWRGSHYDRMQQTISLLHLAAGKE